MTPDREGDLLGAIETLLDLGGTPWDRTDAADGRDLIERWATTTAGDDGATEGLLSAAEGRVTAAEERAGAAEGRADAAEHESEQLQRAMATRASIEQAKGILMQRHGIDPDRAFDLLRRISMRYNVKLHDIAEGLVREASGSSPG
jgi:hypothetical protein